MREFGVLPAGASVLLSLTAQTTGLRRFRREIAKRASIEPQKRRKLRETGGRTESRQDGLAAVHRESETGHRGTAG